MENKEKELGKSRCGHLGKFCGGGQNIINVGNKLLCISNVICGECGSSEIVVTPIADIASKSEPVDKLIIPRMNMPNLKK